MKSQDEKSSIVSTVDYASTSHEVLLVTIFDVPSRDEWIFNLSCS